MAASRAGSPTGVPRAPSWVLDGKYAPSIDPANFVATIDNRYFPLEPGTGFHYRGLRGTTAQTDDMVVTHQIKYVLGVRCTVVRDTVSEHGKPVERTFDWYAQDKQGNVWYMGEEALELKGGRFVRASDSWEAGVNGAKAGIISGPPGRSTCRPAPSRDRWRRSSGARSSRSWRRSTTWPDWARSGKRWCRAATSSSSSSR